MTTPSLLSSSNLIEVPALALKPGMFVAELDRSWLETPFAMQGFVIRDQSDVDYVAQHCAYVYIDPQKKVQGRYLPARTAGRVKEDSVGLKEEFDRVKIDFESASETMEKVFGQIRTNRRVDMDAVRAAINPLIDSVFRNRDALSALIRLKNKGDYLYNHSLACAVWAAILARHLGMEKDTVKDLVLGVSVMDVGMSTLPDELLAKREALSSTELRTIQGHVKESLKMIRADGDVSNRIMNLVACHHERYDGSGYPRGLVGNKIPGGARIAGLVDAYDAMITNRPHAAARSSYEAIQELSDAKGAAFQGSLVEHFVQTIGMFPTGSVVELNSGEVGVVVEQNSTRRLRPKVVLILDEQKAKRQALKVIDLSKYVATSDGAPSLWISRELETGAHGISPEDYFV